LYLPAATSLFFFSTQLIITAESVIESIDEKEKP